LIIRITGFIRFSRVSRVVNIIRAIMFIRVVSVLKRVRDASTIIIITTARVRAQLQL
jgi:hypothetical protein